MDNKLQKIFKKTSYEPEPELAQMVWSAIIARDEKATNLKLWAFAFMGLTSLSGLVFTFKTLFTDMARSGFYEYFSLLFSDTGSILSYWKEFTFSLAESLPIISILCVLSLLLVSFLSLKYLMKQINRNQLISSLTFS